MELIGINQYCRNLYTHIDTIEIEDTYDMPMVYTDWRADDMFSNLSMPCAKKRMFTEYEKRQKSDQCGHHTPTVDKSTSTKTMID